MINHNFDQGEHCVYCGKTWIDACHPETMMPNECKIGPDGVAEIEREAILISKVIKLIRKI